MDIFAEFPACPITPANSLETSTVNLLHLFSKNCLLSKSTFVYSIPLRSHLLFFVACFEDIFANGSGFTNKINYHCLIHVSNTILNNTINITVLQWQMCDYHSMESNFVSIAIAALETDSCKINEILQFTQKNNDRDSREKKNILKKKSQSFAVR